VAGRENVHQDYGCDVFSQIIGSIPESAITLLVDQWCLRRFPDKNFPIIWKKGAASPRLFSK
jgi:hypothetical protein